MGEWDRLCTCRDDDRNKLFFGISGNGARRYCGSQSCGNRLHAARYKAGENAAIDAADAGRAA